MKQQYEKMVGAQRTWLHPPWLYMKLQLLGRGKNKLQHPNYPPITISF